MERTLEFKNFQHSYELLSTDLYLDNRFIVKWSDYIVNIKDGANTGITLYEYFREAALIYLNGTESGSSFTNTISH